MPSDFSLRDSTQSVPPPVNDVNPQKNENRLLLFIDDNWYDLTAWAAYHPGGREILAHLNGTDATDAFYSLHSDDAHKRLKRMKPVTPPKDKIIKPTKATIEFRKFRKQLQDEGWFKKNPFWEVFYHSSVYILIGLGSYITYTSNTLLAQIASILLIGVGMQQSGWIGHDFTHARGNYAWWSSRIVSGLTNAFSPTWWSNKHNTHHVYTNFVGIDVDIQNDPIIHLVFPDSRKDVWFRKFQHFYFFPVISFLFVSWRMQSLQYSISTRNYWELLPMMINYIWLCTLGWKVAIGSILLAGLLVALIVTATHQSEEMYNEESSPLKSYSFIECQFATTRDVYTGNGLMSWLWGGMQYQLEHHLFPTCPKYYNARLTERVKQFAKENGLEYKCDTVMQILKRNFATIKKFAGEGHQTEQTKKRE